LGRKWQGETGEGITIGFKIEDPKVVDSLKKIAKTEGVQLRKIYNKALAEYAERHSAGNPQTLLPSFEKDGVKSLGQIEQEIFTEIKSWKRDVQKWEIMEALEARDIVEVKKKLFSTRLIIKKLTGEGVKVWT
jgi:hypothetical protein